MNSVKKRKGSFDYYLILATVGVLFAISVICVLGMFYFKLASVQQLPPSEKFAYMSMMNAVVAPFIIALILLLGICVPKRLLPLGGLIWFSAGLSITAVIVSAFLGLKMGLVAVLSASLLLQLIVLMMAVTGSEHLRFEKSGYWVRVGSSLVHLGLILFVLDLLLYKFLALHLILFWVTTGSTVLGMLCCFYSQEVARVIEKITK
ncbi:MAG: hypothetical protein OEM01_04940, partial [Desulfobulbaceae bacterium]|nr:hypothetical protein [Desulfobulbaceae bacterium]